MRKSKYTKELLEPIIKESYSIAQVLRSLGLTPSGGTHSYIKSKITYFGIDISHFTGQGWSKGKTAETDETVRRITNKIRIPDDQIFKKNGYPINRSLVRSRLLKQGWKEECSECGLKEWRGNPIAMHLDHINGDPSDNRKENLRFLCPNCHQQTDTWGRK